MNWDNIKGMIAKAAPLIGGAIGGPGGSLVAGWIASELGDDVDPSDPIALEKAIKADPNAMLKLRELEIKHKEKLEEIGMETFKAEVADKNSARDMANAAIIATGERDIFLPILATLVIFGFFGILAAMLFIDLEGMSQGALAILNIMVGFLGAAFMAVIGFFFGASKTPRQPQIRMGK
jgi:hypothetical protein